MKRPGLAELLQAFDAAEFREPVDQFCGGHRQTWPHSVRDSLWLKEMAWRRTAGNIQDRAMVTACVETEGAIWCVLRIYFVHVAEDETVSAQPALTMTAESGAGGEVSQHAAARVASPILNER